jgi:adenylyl cyclase-associated protein
VAEYQAGGGAAAAAAAAPASSAAPAAAPSPAAAAKPAGGPGALFAELNKGGSITSGLKTVTKDMQTWRAEYKAGAAAPAAPAAAAAAAPSSTAGKRVAETVKGPPKLEFNGAQHKWVVENQTADAGVLKVSVYVCTFARTWVWRLSLLCRETLVPLVTVIEHILHRSIDFFTHN